VAGPTEVSCLVRTTSPDDLTNLLISRDRNDYPLVQISRIDGQAVLLGGFVKVNLEFEIGRFGLIVSVGGS